jgi:uncharacterized protein
MKNVHSWNRRDFLARVMSSLAASPLLGRPDFLFGEPWPIAPGARTVEGTAKPICRTLGKTGICLPIVSMGVMNADVPGLIPRSYEVGIRHFDTAAVYQQGRNDEMVGRMIKEMGVRDKVIISTKVLPPGRNRGRDQAQVQTYSAAEVKANFNEVFEGSLKRLQMDYVDILYNHSADSEEAVNSEGTLEAMTALRKEGKARFLGVSSHKPEMALKEAMKLRVYDVVLITINYTMASDQGLLSTIDEAAKKGIGLIAMKTQAGGPVRPDPKLGKPLTPASQTALLKWVLHHDAITTAIPGYTTYEQLEQNFSVASNLGYTAEEREFLSDETIVANAQFCAQCGKCLADCPAGVDIPRLMRSHMYAVQYSSYALAAETAEACGKGLAACAGCETCRAVCRNTVNIAKKIEHLKALAANGLFRA